ncbi:alpha-2,8-polysialyltransferase family protein [Schleiferiaceae bacterium]|nr:alpha-2,8-polysialyltransferase family protein [Schleiferiaceae bacterium]
MGNIKYWQTIFTTLENILIPELALNNYYLYVSKVLQNKHYKLLVVTQSVHGLERYLLDNLSFDKSVEILHGIPSGTIEVGSTDLIIANGLHDKQKLIHSGIESNKILELGVSKYDYLINIDRHYFSIDSEVLLLDPADGYFDKFVSVHKKLLSWYKNNYGSTLYVKPHPRQKKIEIDLIIRVAKNIDLEVIVYNQSIEDTIRNFRGAIVINSTAGVEFGFTGKKLIVPYFLGETYINYEHLPCCELWLKPDHGVLNKGDMKNFYFNNCGRNKEYWKYVIS